MNDITITKIDETWIKVQCAEKHIEMEIADRFSFKVENAQFDPRVKKGHWDGVKRLYNRQYKRMYSGLLFEIIKFAKKQEYSIKVDPRLLPTSSITEEDIVKIVKEVIRPHDNKTPLELYDYQLKAVNYILNMGRTICLAATSSGKSLTIYSAIRIYQLLSELEGRHIFVVVPSKMLVEQLYSDFENYSTFSESNWKASDHCQKIYDKYSKSINRQIVISTWQSLKNLPDDAIRDAGAIFIDEVHTVNGPVLTKLMEGATGCSIRHGLTGTLDNMECNELAAQGLLGPVKRIVTSREIVDAGRATEVEINCVMIDYDRGTKVEFNECLKNVPKTKPAQKYQVEVEFINLLESRFRYIQKLTKSLKGNSIVLFDRVEYGKKLYEDMKAIHSNTFLIIGDVNIDEREEIRKVLETHSDAIVYATSAIMSTGVSIKNLHNIISTSSTKSVIKILQTIGRLMRLHDSKSKAQFFDIVDKIDYNGQKNATLKHVFERIKYYNAEKLKTRFVSVNLVEEQFKQEENTLFQA